MNSQRPQHSPSNLSLFQNKRLLQARRSPRCKRHASLQMIALAQTARHYATTTTAFREALTNRCTVNSNQTEQRHDSKASPIHVHSGILAVAADDNRCSAKYLSNGSAVSEAERSQVHCIACSRYEAREKACTPLELMNAFNSKPGL